VFVGLIIAGGIEIGLAGVDRYDVKRTDENEVSHTRCGRQRRYLSRRLYIDGLVSIRCGKSMRETGTVNHTRHPCQGLWSGQTILIYVVKDCAGPLPHLPRTACNMKRMAALRHNLLHSATNIATSAGQKKQRRALPRPLAQKNGIAVLLHGRLPNAPHSG
jgi:hypothetical protein